MTSSGRWIAWAAGTAWEAGERTTLCSAPVLICLRTEGERRERILDRRGRREVLLGHVGVLGAADRDDFARRALHLDAVAVDGSLQ